jgi:hypothetical protein
VWRTPRGRSGYPAQVVVTPPGAGCSRRGEERDDQGEGAIPGRHVVGRMLTQRGGGKQAEAVADGAVNSGRKDVFDDTKAHLSGLREAFRLDEIERVLRDDSVRVQRR